MADMTDSPTIRPEIALSWRRAALAGLDPDSVGRPTFADVDASSRLMVASGPVLQDLAELMDGNAFSLMLSDRDTRIVYRWGGDHRFTAVLDAYGVVAGVRIDEGSFGTNAMGTAMETGRAVQIHGAEHYLQPYKVLSCYGAPVRHPLTRRIEGVLNITSIGPTSNPLFGPLVERAARDIQVRLIEGARDGERRLFLAFQEATRLRSTPVAVLGGDVVLANRACVDLLGTADASMLHAVLPEVSTNGTAARELDLGPTGRVSVTAERIDGTPDGALFHLGERLGPRFVAATASFPTDRSVLVAGESGTGRTRAAQLVGLAQRHTGAIVIDDVHVLPETLCTVLRRVLASARRGGPVRRPAGHLSSRGTVATCVGRHTVVTDSGVRRLHERSASASADRLPITYEVSSRRCLEHMSAAAPPMPPTRGASFLHTLDTPCESG